MLFPPYDHCALKNSCPAVGQVAWALKIQNFRPDYMRYDNLCLLLLRQSNKRYVCLCVHLHRIYSVPDNTQHIKTGHDWLRQVHILSKSQRWVIPAACKETSTESEDMLKGSTLPVKTLYHLLAYHTYSKVSNTSVSFQG